ncbi:FAD-dependent oxidoreductase [Azospirillum doebereinerae]
MTVDYQTLILDYRRSPDQDAGEPARHPVVVVGAGPVGLTTAIDLAQRGVRVVLLDDDRRLSFGSRGLCYAKRTLEILDRLGCGQRVVDKGVSWNVGKVFFQDGLVYEFDLLPESGHRRPAFINLQQYYLEGYLHDHAATLETLDIRWRNKVVGVAPGTDGVELLIDTPDGSYALRCDYLVACDGSRSPVRGMMGLESKGRVFRDRFLIADVRMTADFPTERWFWFDPPFHRNQSVLLHRQPDNVWRIDFQLGWDADPEEEKKPEKVIPRIRALLGNDVDFTFDWVSVYTFACLRMDDFRHGRVLFAGDSAHGVSPFGARGANSGMQDADNLAWKLHLVLDGRAPDRLLDSYASEREFAADENIRNSTRSTDFITPKSEVSRLFRDAALSLSRDCAFARRLVNSGRLSVPSVLTDSPLNTPDSDAFAGAMTPGASAADAPVRSGGHDGWFLDHVGTVFTAVCFVGAEPLADESVAALRGLAEERIPVRVVVVAPPGTAMAGVDVVEDAGGLLAQRYDARPGTVYLLRPDQHVCARWRAFDPARVRSAVATATGKVGAYA